VANFISRQDLYRFQNVASPGITQFRLSAKMPMSHTEDSRKSISAANVTKQFKPKPRAEIDAAELERSLIDASLEKTHLSGCTNRVNQDFGGNDLP
jgi:hypothetical protein